jgi:hypothetical protein
LIAALRRRFAAMGSDDETAPSPDSRPEAGAVPTFGPDRAAVAG